MQQLTTRSVPLCRLPTHAKQGYTVHEEDEWGGDLGVNERKAIRHTLLRGTDYWFCVGADLDNARVAIHVYDERGRLAEVDDWQNGPMQQPEHCA